MYAGTMHQSRLQGSRLLRALSAPRRPSFCFGTFVPKCSALTSSMRGCRFLTKQEKITHTRSGPIWFGGNRETQLTVSAHRLARDSLIPEIGSMLVCSTTSGRGCIAKVGTRRPRATCLRASLAIRGVLFWSVGMTTSQCALPMLSTSTCTRRISSGSLTTGIVKISKLGFEPYHCHQASDMLHQP